ncbi:hypothetical protein ANCCAN_00204 [Ancylostoma caninum]|uniref:ShKT domain-containing protein n=1 Tax=Ancylostoma caninum TaxID=29170 RepID=A0A368HE65_ANCCA|nr:hypothetical protein ANCCAN_00204 [Ancylostoma caninum]
MKFFCTSSSFLLLSTLLHIVQNEEDKYLITLVYRFVFANEAICGDPFADPEWLPAAEECYVNCDPAVHMCLIHTRTNVQKCRLFSQECQAAIRKHLGWSSTVVSIYRPEEITTAMPAFVTAQPEANADRSAVEAAEDIERDLMGHTTPPSMPVPVDGLSSKEASMSVEVITPPSATNRVDWVQPPPAEDNGYTFEERQSSATPAPQDGYDGVAEQASEYDGGGVSNNHIESEPEEQEVEAAQEDMDYAPAPTSAPLARKKLKMKLIPPDRPKPAPPAFPPYYLKNRHPTLTPIAAIPPSQQDIVPKYINFLEPPEDTDEVEPFTSSSAPQPPGYRPLGMDELNNIEETNSLDNLPEKMLEPPDETTWETPTLVHTLRPYPMLREIPGDSGMVIPRTLMFRGDDGDNTNGARFEPGDRCPELFRLVFAKCEHIPEKARDHSSRCCEWSLNGLCDSHWQRVRQICPKSCGTLVCEDVEGIKSCTRVVDVDVEDCFQSTRLTRYFGLKNAETDEEKRSIIDGIVQQKLSRLGTKRKSRKRRH